MEPVVKPSVTVRAATTEDAPFLRAMIWQALLASPDFVARVGESTLAAMEARSWFEWSALPSDARSPAFIAHTRVQDLGAIVLKNDVQLTDEDRARRAGAVRPGVVVERWRFGMGVIASARGQGAGRALLEHAIAYARAAGALEMSLLVDSHNARARALYDALGFRVVGEKDAVVEMRLPLT